jgi:uncharacterized protein YbjT (DUF2867 family)
MRPARTALIAGATGLVGQACLVQLLRRPEYDRVVALVRRPLDIADTKLQPEIVDFDHPESMRPVAADVAFCALGTTMAKAGSPEAFRRVDYLSVLTVADLALQGGVGQFVLVSSVGADPTSGNFYLRVKGEADAAVSKRSFRAVHILRPGLLLGSRPEVRTMESIAQTLAPLLNPLLRGRLVKYRAIPAAVVGAAMVAASLEGTEGVRTLLHQDIVRLAGLQA